MKKTEEKEDLFRTEKEWVYKDGIKIYFEDPEERAREIALQHKKERELKKKMEAYAKEFDDFINQPKSSVRNEDKVDEVAIKEYYENREYERFLH